MAQKIEKLLRGEGENYIFPFFWQHGESEEVLRQYMKVIHESNIGAVCVESRPHPDFCGDKWWQDMDVILDEARKRNMKVWILDDSHFPTGFANGAMKKEPQELCRQSICCRITKASGGERVCFLPDQILHPDPFEKTQIENFVLTEEMRTYDDDVLWSIYAVPVEDSGKVAMERRIDLKDRIREDTLEWEVPEGNWKIYTLHLSRNFGYHRSYINMMDHRSCRVLLDAVYEPHYAHYAADFGTTIAGFFSDEPELGNGHIYDYKDPFGVMKDYPWSAELEEKLRDLLGEDRFGLMPLLWETQADPDKAAKVRYAYMNAVSLLVRDDFSYQIGNWCREHGVQYIGHMIEDNNHHSRTGSSLGHYFRGLEGQDMAGIDDIGGQVLPQGEELDLDNGPFQTRNGRFYHYLLGKLGSSAAAIEPWKNGNSMCEVFGAYSWQEGVQLEKYLADHFMVRGINHFVPHAFSPKDFPDPDCPPHFYAHGHNPQYRHFGALMLYMNRICSLISDGRHVAPVAVLYHGEGDWTGACMTDEVIGQVLCDSQIEYDIVPSDVFVRTGEYFTRIQDGILGVNRQEYRALVIPAMDYITKETATAVLTCQKEGVFVCFAGGYPKGISNTPIGADEDADLIERLRSVPLAAVDSLVQILDEEGVCEVAISPKDNRIRYHHYVHEDGTQVYYFVNEGTKTYGGEVVLSLKVLEDSRSVYEYDAWENALYEVKREGPVVSFSVEPRKSFLLVLDKEKVCACGKRKDLSNQRVLMLESGWKRSTCSALCYPDFKMEKEITLPDHLEEEEPLFSGFVRYETGFDAKEKEEVVLEISDAAEGVEVFINGKSLGIQIVPTYRYDLTGHLKDGRNELRIEVATTLEREMSTQPMFGMKVDPTSKSGITGRVQLVFSE